MLSGIKRNGVAELNGQHKMAFYEPTLILFAFAMIFLTHAVQSVALARMSMPRVNGHCMELRVIASSDMRRAARAVQLKRPETLCFTRQTNRS